MNLLVTGNQYSSGDEIIKDMTFHKPVFTDFNYENFDKIIVGEK